MKKVIATLLAVLMVLSMASLYSFAETKLDTSALSAKIESAKLLIYKGSSEQTRKYLADRTDRAESVLYNRASVQADIDSATAMLETAINSLKGMNAFELIAINGSAVWTSNDIALMSESVGTVSLDTVNKPEETDFSVKVSSDAPGFSNASSNIAVSGTTPFGSDMTVADGLKVWFGVDRAAVFCVSIGLRSEECSYTYTLSDIHVNESGYLFLPFDCFNTTDAYDIALDGSMNYFAVSAAGIDEFNFALVSAYNEILESSTVAQYSETKITSRGQIEDYAYYKIIETSSEKALAITPDITETSNDGDKTYIKVEDDTVDFSLEKSAEGDLKQLWQLAPSPAGNNSFRIINKATSQAIQIASSGNSVENKKVDLNSPLQEWTISITSGKATLQVRSVGKLTTAGDAVKATSGSTYKKFYLYRVVDKEYQESWNDEFDGDKLDRNKWVVNDGYYAGGGISTIHTDDEGENLKVENGMLNLTTVVERCGSWEADATYMSTSGKFAMSYGRIDIRAKLATGEGQFPALWLMPSDMMNMGAGEIDIMEMDAQEIDQTGIQIGTIHYTTEDGYTHYSKCYKMQIFGFGEKYLGDDFHIYSVEMDHDQVRYYFDGIQYMSLVINDQAKKFAFGDMARYIIINNSLRGKEGEGAFINYNFDIPDEYTTQIDYVKCYLESGEMSDNTVDLTTEDSISYSNGINAVATSAYYDVNFPTDIKSDGTEGAVADQYNDITIFDPITGITKKVIRNFAERSLRVKYSPDGSKLAVATTQGCIAIYDTSDYDKTPITIINGAVIQENVLFTNDSNYLIVGGFNGGSQAYKNPIYGTTTEKWCFRVFDATDGTLSKEINIGDDPRYITLSDDGSLLAVTTTSHGTYIFNTSDWSEYAHLEGNHEDAVRGADFSADGKLLVTSDENGNIVIWDVVSKSFVKKMNNVNTGSVRRVFFSNDGKNVLATSTYGAARLFNVKSGEAVSLLGGFGNVIREIAYSPNGEFIVAAAYDGGIKLFAKDGTYLQTLKAGETDSDGEGYIISGIRFTSDSRYVYISTRTFPHALQRWVLPNVVDKSALCQRIAGNSPSSEGYDYAVKVASLKYATESMVADACLGLGVNVLDYPTTASIAAENISDAYVSSIKTNSNRYFYFKSEIPAKYNVDVKITNDLSGESEFVKLDGYNVISSRFNPNTLSVERIIKMKITEGGDYTIRLADADGAFFPCAYVTVNDKKVSYQDDFLYSISAAEVTILAAISGKQNVVIPDRIDGWPVVTIGEYAFNNYGTAISHMSVQLPSELVRIESYAFNYCSSLRTIDLPKDVNFIGEKAFYFCRLLDNVVIPSECTVGTSAFDRAGIGTLTIEAGTEITSSSKAFANALRTRELIIGEGSTVVNINLSSQYLMERVYVPATVSSMNSQLFSSQKHKVKLYGVPGTYAETYANSHSSVYEFVPIAAPIISGVTEGETYDVYTQTVSATWNDAHAAYLNGEPYKAGTPITEAGEYTLKVINGYDVYSTEARFTVVDTTPPLYKLGDLDEDGEITVTDALAVLRFAAKLTVPEGNQFLAADVDKDEEITVTDALMVLRVAAKLQESL